MIIAIDGTTASGKGTLARRLSTYLKLPYLDTGLLYRAVGVAASRRPGGLSDPDHCAAIAATIRLDAFLEQELRTAAAGEAASRVAAMPAVRAVLLALQRSFAAQPGGAVLDGRDIGTVIAPQAEVKFWVDASLVERARRRWRELTASGTVIDCAEVEAAIAARDARDRMRPDAPAFAAPDAIVIDTTALAPDEVLAEALAFIPAP